jgi:hypothetical protein
VAGVVRDTSGAVLPGVTVEVESPALIERMRTAVTDGTGQYRVENLRPGAYAVTFTLPGFSTVRREGIVLTGTFVATVNAEMRVGSLEETITVTGETPVVDVQSTTRQRVLTQEVLDTVPAARIPMQMVALIPGVTTTRKDVGGLLGDGSARGDVLAHGVADVRMLVNGVSLHSANGTGSTSASNLAVYQEVVVDTGGVTAEQKEGGVRINLIPRDGGNALRGYFLGAFANSSMQGSNFTQELRDRGLGTPDAVKKLWDVNPALGGPIKRDKVWFHGAMRYTGTQSRVPVFFNKNVANPNVWTYEPDTSRESAWTENIWRNGDVRITWQATSKHKIAAGYGHSINCDCPRNLPTNNAPEAAAHRYLDPKRMIVADWTAPLTNRVLLEAAFLKHDEQAGEWVRPEFADYYGTDDLQGPVGVPRLIRVLEQSSNLSYRGGGASETHAWNRTNLWRAAASYITGAHAFKVGIGHELSNQDELTYSAHGPLTFRFNSGVPNQVTLQATPYRTITRWHELGVFVQDRWTVRRLTLTGGLRYDYRRGTYPGVTVGAGEFAPTRNIVIPTAPGTRWHDISPRAGAAVNVFGDGKTALKINLGKYLAVQNALGGLFGRNAAPVRNLVLSANRSWADANGDFVPNCDLLDPLANGECGALSNRNFGTVVPGRAVDPATERGWGRRYANWQFSAGVQRELVSRVSLDVSYFRTWFLNHIVTDDRTLTAADFDMFSITAPAHPSLPGGGGYVIGGLYDVKPASFGLATNEIMTFARNYGKVVHQWNGVDVTLNAQPREGLMVQGGVSTGRTTRDDCEVRAKLPETALANPYCRLQEDFLTSIKFIGSYLIPRIDVQFSTSFRSEPGPERAANYTAATAEVSRSLGRNLSGGARNVTVNLVEPGTLFGERLNQLDVRFAKILRAGRTRTTASIDVYNALNGNPVLTESAAFATWLRPENILNARFAKVVVQLDF